MIKYFLYLALYIIAFVGAAVIMIAIFIASILYAPIAAVKSVIKFSREVIPLIKRFFYSSNQDDLK